MLCLSRLGEDNGVVLVSVDFLVASSQWWVDVFGEKKRARRFRNKGFWDKGVSAEGYWRQGLRDLGARVLATKDFEHKGC